MEFYKVGGAIRDELMGRPVQDNDWVVVGATPEALLAKGYRPVGKDFPVFLHPKTHEEVALARTERKTGKGYHGFAFYADASVTLEEDLARRDLTINAIAQDEQGHLIDPYGGQQDIKDKVLRHVTEAFSEDPVRILRVARLAARYEDFVVAPETMSLMHEMVLQGEADALVPERVWQEIAKGLMECKPSRMLWVLHECGALERIFPEVAALFIQKREVPQSHGEGAEAGASKPIQTYLDQVLDDAANPIHQKGYQALYEKKVGASAHPFQGVMLSVSFALLTFQIREASVLQQFCLRARIPNPCKELALLAQRELSRLYSVHNMGVKEVFELMQRADAFRQPERFLRLIICHDLDARIMLEDEEQTLTPTVSCWIELLTAVMRLDTAPISAQALKEGKRGAEIGEAIDAARREIIQGVLSGQQG